MSCGTKVPLLPLISSTFITVNLYSYHPHVLFFLLPFGGTNSSVFAVVSLCRHRLWDVAACATARARAGAPVAAILYYSTPLFSVGRAFGGSSGGQGSMGPRLKASAAVQCALADV